MFSTLTGIDWSSMHHAYGPADDVPAMLTALRSTDAEERREALDTFYSAVHHQGDVYECTTATLPFLFELAGDPAAPDRDSLVGLLVSIGSSAVESCSHDYITPMGYASAAAVLRERAEEFVTWASDADHRVRRAAIPGLGLFLDDGERAAAVLRSRLRAEPWLAERLLVVEAMATLALRLPSVAHDALAWFAELRADPALDPATRLAAVVQQARCVPKQIRDDAVPTAIGLLRQLTDDTSSVGEWWDPPRPPAPALTASDGVPRQIAAAFEDLDRHGRRYAPTTDLLRTLHEVLADRVPDRTALLTQQLYSPDPGSRLDAIRMSADLVRSWRGDHSSLVRLVAEQLDPACPDIAAEAAATLESWHAVAEPAREALASYVAAQRAEHGPDVWAAPQPRLRRAHQEAVRALARLGDDRAVPSVLSALEGDVDTWRAVQIAGDLPQAADRLTLLLCEHLRRIDLAQESCTMSTKALLSALAELGDHTALPTITDVLASGVRLARPDIIEATLNALAAFGPAAKSALGVIRPLTEFPGIHVRPAAIAALWAVGGDRDEIMPLASELLDGSAFFWITQAADILGEMGPYAEPALPRLRTLMADNYEWVRVHSAAAIWEIGGEPEAPAVLKTLLQAWEQNDFTARRVVACLDRMGPAAAPALPRVYAELARPRRSGWPASIAKDEELLRLCRSVVLSSEGASSATP